MNGITWAAVVTEDGKLVPDERRAFRAYVSQWKGEAVEIIVRRKPKPITRKQRGWHWGVLVRAFADYTGEASLLVAHFQLKRLCLCTPDEDTPSTGAEGNRDAHSELIERAQAFLIVDCGVVLPEPEPPGLLEHWERFA